MWRLLPVIGVMWLGCSKCSPSEPAVSTKAVPVPAACTEAFLEVVPLAHCEEKCTAGDAEACAVAADIHRRGLKTKRDKKLGFERASRSCELGSSSGCSSVASWWLAAAVDAADGGEPDVSRFEAFDALAMKHAERECSEGRARSCEALSFWYAKLERVNGKEDPRTLEVAKRSTELYRAGCDRGDWFMCRRLALTYKVGALDLERDLLAARKLYAKACKLGDAVSCKDSFDDDADDATSSRSLQRGCELGDASSCFLWSLRLSGKQANEALGRACELGDVLACRDLAYSRKASGDLEGARQAQQAACEMGEDIPCPGN